MNAASGAFLVGRADAHMILERMLLTSFIHSWTATGDAEPPRPRSDRQFCDHLRTKPFDALDQFLDRIAAKPKRHMAHADR